MFTSEEQMLLTGSDEDVDEFIESDYCLIVDWRGTEQEMVDDAIRFLPDGDLTYGESFPGDDTVAIRLRFRDREDSFSLPFQPQNNFRVLLRVWRLLQPDYDIKLFRRTDGSDTHGFLVRPSEWWDEFRRKFPEPYRKVFREVTDLTQLWDLDAPPRPDAPMRKPWWRFW